MDKIAVLIPCYNEEKTIEKAVTIPVFFASCHVVCNKSDRVELKN